MENNPNSKRPPAGVGDSDLRDLEINPDRDKEPKRSHEEERKRQSEGNREDVPGFGQGA